MKRISSFLISVLCSATALAQSTNPLNYSGKMFVSSYEILSTPRYVSYEDHGILNSELTIPVTEITTLISDFENGTLKSGETEYKIKVTDTKKYTLTDDSWVVVIYIEQRDGTNRFEYVWREYGCAYLNTINKEEDGSFRITRMNLSRKPQITSPEEAILQMLNSYGGY